MSRQVSRTAAALAVLTDRPRRPCPADPERRSRLQRRPGSRWR
ncbi:hypothetical protein [Kitasatospora sp. SUK 42]|nr:hypothetical protein [Kitasatospora sp. SUK 42]